MSIQKTLFAGCGLLLLIGGAGCATKEEPNAPPPGVGMEQISPEKRAEMMRRRLPGPAGEAAAKTILSHK